MRKESAHLVSFRESLKERSVARALVGMHYFRKNEVRLAQLVWSGIGRHVEDSAALLGGEVSSCLDPGSECLRGTAHECSGNTAQEASLLASRYSSLPPPFLNVPPAT